MVVCVFTQHVGVDVSEDGLVGGLEDDWWGDVSVDGFDPSAETETPPVTRFEAWKVKFGPGREQIVAPSFRKREELPGHHGTQFVTAMVAVDAPTTPITKEPCRRIHRAGFERLAVHVPVRSHTLVVGWEQQKLPGYGSSGHSLGALLVHVRLSVGAVDCRTGSVIVIVVVVAVIVTAIARRT